MFRTRVKNSIVTEFLPPGRSVRKQKIIILCDGMPSVPRKQPLAEFLSKRGYWVFYPRYRGAWESDGIFLEKSPHLDILDIIDELLNKKKIIEKAFYQEFIINPDEFFIIGGSFGGAAALLLSLDARVKKVIANCPVVDWSVLPEEEKKETANKSYPAFIKDSFGNAYKLSEKNWKKLYSGKFFNPANHISEINPDKILMFHAKDDPYIPWNLVEDFAGKTGIKLKLLKRGGHLRTEMVITKYWDEINKFFKA
jgi:pimeloyl-ACP methyl ester carboxylesterase